MYPTGIPFSSSLPSIRIGKKMNWRLSHRLGEESQVIFHCTFTASDHHDRIRVCGNTFLFPHESRRHSRLVHSENIAGPPSWTVVLPGMSYRFLLVFSGLPKGCRSFDLVEHSAESNPFLVKDITRNDTDVYQVRLV
jgi:hypothetical protein